MPRSGEEELIKALELLHTGLIRPTSTSGSNRSCLAATNFSVGLAASDLNRQGLATSLSAFNQMPTRHQLSCIANLVDGLLSTQAS
ncbi:unnamed protein product [Protopolystoma xenopodis]|uniref:Uncharacterized protein n=1 Tax=Protopolystoma xenopodis TaxID=117903 RepID=A0A3S5A0V2_9PLAT|nr:unnamed protein product [Protopolystoma xenopodis]